MEAECKTKNMGVCANEVRLFKCSLLAFVLLKILKGLTTAMDSVNAEMLKYSQNRVLRAVFPRI
jgi:hypothetical protein